ncbi:MAG: alpha/beta hydrolase [Rhodococcus sp. (in: high G+C Gram-positive bacteria)]|uniref:alpha/beta hydrolase n=1 Tax=Rhodococcus sp. TaxID=1831 RepID=UPI002AD6F4DF|nr:alpha/beta hydrolase [Rhodococcus sp. (in: high G+C Gram-positive bacteria)]
MKSQSFRSAAAVFAVIGLLAAGCSQPPDPADAEPELASLAWGDCPDGVENSEDGPPRLQCATVPVPLDYDDPDGTQIDLTISKLSSSNPEQRRGVLLLNPGGPGGTGLDQPTFLASLGMPKDVLDSYDLIGMDIRGVGHSAPISCGFTDELQYYGAVPPYAFDEAAFDEQVATSKEVAERCAANDVDGRLGHISTANIARDLDRIRAALGEETASFLGYSYGTALGAAYASMFPDTSDRIVLDSNIGDTHLDREGMRRYGLGMEQTFPDFAKWAADNNDRYSLGTTPDEVRSTYFRLADRLDRASFEDANGRAFRLATFASLYNPRSYEGAAQFWQSALTAPDSALDSEPPTPDPTPSVGDNSWSVFLAVTCNDVQWSEDIADYRQAVEEDGRKFPLFGAATANIMPCAFWKNEPAEAPVAVETDGPRNILVAQNRRDPVTPLRGGDLIDEKFGDRSALLTVDGSGHGVYVLGTNPCAQKTVTNFLVEGTMPEEGATC